MNDHSKAAKLTSASTCSRNGTCEHILLDSLRIGQSKLYAIKKGQYQGCIQKKLNDKQQYDEVINGASVSFRLDGSIFSFSDGDNNPIFSLNQYIWYKNYTMNNHTNGKYIFSSSNGSIPLTPDADQSFYLCLLTAHRSRCISAT